MGFPMICTTFARVLENVTNEHHEKTEGRSGRGKVYVGIRQIFGPDNIMVTVADSDQQSKRDTDAKNSTFFSRFGGSHRPDGGGTCLFRGGEHDRT